MSNKNERLFKSCTNCGERVHARAKACSSCGAPSPWLSDEGKPEIKVENAAGANVAVAAIPQKEAQYIVLRDYKQMVGDVMIALKKNQIVIDRRLIEKLVASGAPVVPVGDEQGIVSCPRCEHVFDVASAQAKAKVDRTKAA